MSCPIWPILTKGAPMNEVEVGVGPGGVEQREREALLDERETRGSLWLAAFCALSVVLAIVGAVIALLW